MLAAQTIGFDPIFTLESHFDTCLPFNNMHSSHVLFPVTRNTSKWDWQQVLPTRASSFKWVYATTPLSSLPTVLTAWTVYFTTIILLKRYMATRNPLSLKSATATHNLVLCVWSSAMCLAGAAHVYSRAKTRGIREIFVTSDKSSVKGPLEYVMYCYYLSKFYELLDTAFIILKKKPLIFLHYYHHAIVIAMVWSWLQSGLMYAYLGMIANTFIHVFMYYYYYRASLGKSTWFKKYITTGQIIQFGLSFALCVPYVYYQWMQPGVGLHAFVFGMMCNGSFLYLFIRFYKRAYKAKGQ